MKQTPRRFLTLTGEVTMALQALPGSLHITPDSEILARVQGAINSKKWFFVPFDQLNDQITAPTDEKTVEQKIDAIFLRENALIEKAALETHANTNYDIQSNTINQTGSKGSSLAESIYRLKACRQSTTCPHDTIKIFKITAFKGK